MRCGGANHFSGQCFARNISPQVHEVSAQHSEVEFFIDSLYVGNINASEDGHDPAWFSILKEHSSHIRMKLDTGAAANILPLKTFNKLENLPQLQPSNVKLKAYGGHTVEHEGKVELECSANGQECKLDFLVTTTKAPPVLGLKACLVLGLIQKGDQFEHSVDSVDKPITLSSLLQEFQDVFEGLGKFPEAYHIQTKPKVEPVIQPLHRVPHSLYDRLKHKLDDMEKNDVIAKVDCPTDWVNNIVVVEKKGGDLRICLDPKDLNLAIRREHFQIPTYDDVVSHLGGKRFFTILDQKDSYWQVPLSEESSYLCTFNSPFGCYRYLGMPFGICSASEKNIQVIW